MRFNFDTVCFGLKFIVIFLKSTNPLKQSYDQPATFFSIQRFLNPTNISYEVLPFVDLRVLDATSVDELEVTGLNSVKKDKLMIMLMELHKFYGY